MTLRRSSLLGLPLLWASLLSSGGCDPAPDPVDGGEATPDASASIDAAIDAAIGGDASASDAGPPPERGIRIEGRRLLVDGAPFEIRGVCWSPVARGESLPPDYAGFAPTDIPLMQAAGINVVRAYGPILDRGVLDQLSMAGIYLIQSVYVWGGADPSEALEPVRATMDHPAILMWALGNEWNYNGLYVGLPFAEARDRLEGIAAAIHEIDPAHPVVSVYGELPTPETLAAMPSIDLWALNVYRGISFGDLFDRWAERSPLPMFLGEYGADAWDARGAGMESPEAQAEATEALTGELLAQSTARSEAGVALGGTLFEWADEWWKDGSGSPSEHDVGGVAPGGGPHPDATFNEEWWGVVDIDRRPRLAYDTLRRLYSE